MVQDLLSTKEEYGLSRDLNGMTRLLKILVAEFMVGL